MRSDHKIRFEELFENDGSVNTKVALKIYALAEQIARENATKKDAALPNKKIFSAEQITPELEFIIAPMLQQLPLTDEASYQHYLKKINEWNVKTDDADLISKLATVQGVLLSLVPIYRNIGDARFLQFRLELLEEFKKNQMRNAFKEADEAAKLATEAIIKMHDSSFVGIQSKNYFLALKNAADELVKDIKQEERKRTATDLPNDHAEVKSKYELEMLLYLIFQIRNSYLSYHTKTFGTNIEQLSLMLKTIGEIVNTSRSDKDKINLIIGIMAKHFENQKGIYKGADISQFFENKGFIAYLNHPKEQNKHHFSRLVGLALKEAFSQNLGGCVSNPQHTSIQTKVEKLRQSELKEYQKLSLMPAPIELTRPRGRAIRKNPNS